MQPKPNARAYEAEDNMMLDPTGPTAEDSIGQGGEPMSSDSNLQDEVRRLQEVRDTNSGSYGPGAPYGGGS